MNNSSAAMKIFLISLEQCINKALELDPTAQQQLSSLGLQCIKTTITDWNMTFDALLRGGKVELLESSEQEADFDIQCSLNRLLDLVTEDEKGQVHIHEDAEVSGNSDLLVSLHRIFTSAEPDYEAALSRWIGPVVAHQIGQTIRSGLKWADSVRKSAMDDIQLCVHEESALFPHPLEVEAFYSDISHLEAEVEALTKAVAQLRAEQMEANEAGTATDKRGSSSCD